MTQILVNKVNIQSLTRLYLRKSELFFNTKHYRNSRNYSIDLSSYSSAFIKISESIANSSIVESTKSNLILFHDWSCISWPLEIAIMTIAIRSVVTFPLSISQQKTLAKFELLKPEMELFRLKLKRNLDSSLLHHNNPLKARLRFNLQMKQELKRLIIRDNCHPMKASLVVLFQMPFWVIISHAIRNMSFMYPIADEKALIVHKQLTSEGILWFTDLTQSDPYYILPVLVGIINLSIIELHSNERLKKLKKKTRMHTIITNSCRAMSLALIPIGCYMPSFVVFYWLISSSMGFIQSQILYEKRFKQFIGINNNNGLKIDCNKTQ